MKIEILAAGQLRQGPHAELANDYIKRITTPLSINEIVSKHRDEAAMQRDEHQKLESAIKDNAFVIALDERGKTLNSKDFSKHIERCQMDGVPLIQFIIGGANGLSDDIRQRANLLLSFGAQTWPHMLARVMLLEQIYRAQQILARHPYHK